MKTQVTQGQNIIKILSDDFASCLVIEKVLTVNWPDCRGSIGEYYSISNYPNEEREKLTVELNDVLINGDEEKILNSIKTFLNLFTNGEYKICFDDLSRKTSSFFCENQVEYSEAVPENERFSGWLYPYKDRCFFYTIPRENINLERIDFYTNLINNGIRPKIIVFESYKIDTSEYSSSYIIDGHHKLEAYLKLGIDIPSVSILKLEIENNQTQELLKSVHPILKDFEFNHLLKNNHNILKSKS